MPPELTVITDTETNADDGAPRPGRPAAHAPRTPIAKGLASEQVCLPEY